MCACLFQEITIWVGCFIFTTLSYDIYTYYHIFQVHKSITTTMLIGLGILFICLCVRLAAAAFMCRHLKLKERIFVCCTWIPKSIVEVTILSRFINVMLLLSPRVRLWVLFMTHNYKYILSLKPNSSDILSIVGTWWNSTTIIT